MGSSSANAGFSPSEIRGIRAESAFAFSDMGSKWEAHGGELDTCNLIGNSKEAWETAKLRAGRILRENSPKRTQTNPLNRLSADSTN
jgi:hypothetical protein